MRANQTPQTAVAGTLRRQDADQTVLDHIGDQSIRVRSNPTAIGSVLESATFKAGQGFLGHLGAVAVAGGQRRLGLGKRINGGHRASRKHTELVVSSRLVMMGDISIAE